MKHRLEQFLESEKLSKAQFADSINVARAGISHIMAGRNNPSYEFIINTMAKYPDLNIEWLLTGKGNMYKNQQYSEDTDLFASQESEDVLSPSDKPMERVAPRTPAASSPAKRKRIVILYDDGSYEEFS